MNTDRRPFVLIWEVTQACDLACKHCRADARPCRHPDELTTAEGKRLLEDLRGFGEGQLVVLSGGDPLVRNDVHDLLDYGTDIGLTMTLTPSGTGSLRAETIAGLRDAGLRRLALSLDGASATSHDEFRGEPGSFARTVEAARTATELDVPLQINTTVCAETVEELPAIRRLVEELDTVLWSVFFLVPIGRGAELEQLSPGQAEGVMRWLYDVATEGSVAIKTTEAPHYRRVIAQQRSATDGEGPRDRSNGIIAGDGFAFVSHTGEVFPSGFLPRSAGSVRDESIVDIYREAPLFRSLRDRDQLRGKCGACPYRAICGGSRSRAYATTGDPLESDPLCAYRP